MLRVAEFTAKTYYLGLKEELGSTLKFNKFVYYVSFIRVTRKVNGLERLLSFTTSFLSLKDNDMILNLIYSPRPRLVKNGR